MTDVATFVGTELLLCEMPAVDGADLCRDDSHAVASGPATSRQTSTSRPMGSIAPGPVSCMKKNIQQL